MPWRYIARALVNQSTRLAQLCCAVCLSLPYAIMHCRCANSLHVDCIIRRLIYSYFKHSCCLPTSVNARRHCLTTSPDWKCLWHVYVSTGRNVLAVVHYRPGSAYSAYEPVLRWFRRRCGACDRMSYVPCACHSILLGDLNIHLGVDSDISMHRHVTQLVLGRFASTS